MAHLQHNIVVAGTKKAVPLLINGGLNRASKPI